MKLRYLHTFIVVAEELHFGRAAKRLHVAQPAISQTIQALEQEIGTQLFCRNKRTVSLNESGKIFLEESYSLLNSLEEAVNRAVRASTGEIGVLHISFTSVSTLSLLPHAIMEFSKQYPKVQIKLEEMGTSEQLLAIDSGQIDVGFSVFGDNISNLSAQSITSEPLYAFLADSHPLSGQKFVSIEDIFSEPFILMSKSSEPEMHSAFHTLCDEYNCKPNIVLEIDNLEAMLAFVGSGYGLSLAPQSVTLLSYPNTIGIPVQPYIESGISMIWNSTITNSTKDNFLNIVEEMRT